MKRREFGMFTGSALLAGSAAVGARAATPDVSLLKTTLTPMGAERAGNADGSIPAWTGGMVDPNSPVLIDVFTDEKPYLTVNSGNMAQYQHLLSEGVMSLMTKTGFSIQVYPTHRTAACPQYVYDNTAKNVATAALNPNGGRFGFTGAYGGAPFPIPDLTADPLVSGAQIIWNFLTHWTGYCISQNYQANFVMSGGQLELSEADNYRAKYPYYDPNGSLETFEGYFSKTLYSFTAPGSMVGQEDLLWHTVNVQIKPDITWELLNGQGRVRKAPDLQFDAPDAAEDGITNEDETQGFAGNPSQYDWRYIGKQEMFIPYNNNHFKFVEYHGNVLEKFINPDIVRWEKHRVWVVEATLHPGIRNVIARRRVYIDEDTWIIGIADEWDGGGTLLKLTQCYNNIIPSLPGLLDAGSSAFNLSTGDWVAALSWKTPPYNMASNFSFLPDTYFDPQQMAANASF